MGGQGLFHGWENKHFPDQLHGKWFIFIFVGIAGLVALLQV